MPETPPRLSVACILCGYVASATREDIVLAALMEHVTVAHPETHLTPSLDATVVDALHKKPS